MTMNKEEQEVINEVVEEKSKFRKLLRYTSEDLTDLSWDYDRMSTSGQETYDRLARMYAMRYEQETGNVYGGDHNALPK